MGPVGPVFSASPTGPVGPVGPVAPVGPVNPVGPSGPRGPLHMLGAHVCNPLPGIYRDNMLIKLRDLLLIEQDVS